MRRAGERGFGRLFLFLLCGIIIGTIVGHILALYVDHPVFTDTFKMGTIEGPFTLYLTVFSITLGFVLNVNFGTVLGVIIGLILFFRG